MSRCRRKDRLDEDQLSVAEVVKRQRRLDEEQEVVTHTLVFASALKNVPDTPSEFHSVDGLQQGIDDVQDDVVIMNIDKRTTAYVPKRFVILEHVLIARRTTSDAGDAEIACDPVLCVGCACEPRTWTICYTGLRRGQEHISDRQSYGKWDASLLFHTVPAWTQFATPLRSKLRIWSLFSITMIHGNRQLSTAGPQGRAATLGNEDVREMDPDTLNDAEDDDQLESDDPEVVAPIPLPCSGIEDRERLLTADALNNSYVRVVHYQEAIVMHDKATTYHDGMTTTLKTEDHTRWDREIDKAEVERIKDYKAMDIMKTRDIKQPLAMSSTDTPAAKGSDPNEDWIRLSLMIEEQQRVPHCLIVTEYKVKILHRIEIQDKVRQLIWSPREEDRKAVEAGHDTIAKQLTILAAFQAKAGYIVQDLRRPPEPAAEMFDNLDKPPLLDPDADLHPEHATAPENTILPLPSSANIPLDPLCPLEIKLRIEQADRYLQNLRGDIAEKSFLYTNIMLAKTIKAVMTRARGTIAKINYCITSVCRGYSRCQLGMFKEVCQIGKGQHEE
ncbi:hypothetical protein DXG01_001766 [Tephrocybe rancida]|nr:hypothetical protein DXG01_001766 [Tephrocybe rancida]